MPNDFKLEVLDPTEEPIPAHAIVAPRPETFDGTVIGLLANGKHNADSMLEMVYEVLADRYEFKEVVATSKGNASRPCPPDLMADLAKRCDHRVGGLRLLLIVQCARRD